MKMHSDNLPMEDTGILNQDNKNNMPDSMNLKPGEVPGNGKLINGLPTPSLPTQEPINHIAGKAPDSMNRSPVEVPGNGKLINGSPAPSLPTREPINHIAGKAPDSMNLKPGEVPGNGKLINGLPTPSLPTQEPINHITGKAPDPETLEKPTRRRYTAQFTETNPGRTQFLSCVVRAFTLRPLHGVSKGMEILPHSGPKNGVPSPARILLNKSRLRSLKNRKLRKKLDRANLLLEQKKITDGNSPDSDGERRRRLLGAVQKVSKEVGVRPVFPVFIKFGRKGSKSGKHFRALSEQEKSKVLECLNSERFMDKAPAQVYATLLDEGVYLCSISTMYRILRENQQVRERRNQLQRPNYKKPELLATGPNQVWSWDKRNSWGP